MTVNELRQLPKIELHCHLDGSLSKEFVETQMKRDFLERDMMYFEQ